MGTHRRGKISESTDDGEFAAWRMPTHGREVTMAATSPAYRSVAEITNGTAPGGWHPPGMGLRPERLASAAPRIDFPAAATASCIEAPLPAARCAAAPSGKNSAGSPSPHDFIARIRYAADERREQPPAAGRR
jgi:hypothetical protein